MQAIKTSDSTKMGKILIVVFKDGLPASGIEVKTSQGVFVTNSAGVISTDMPADTDQKLEVKGVGEKIKVRISSDQESQVTVNLLTDQNSLKKNDVAVEAATGNLEPKNMSAEKGKAQFKVTTAKGPLAEATVLFSGVEGVYKTDASGQVNAEIPEGTYSVSFFHPEYQTATLAEFKIQKDQPALANVEMRPAQNELEEVLVLAPKIKGSLSSLVEVRKQSSAVTDVLGAEQMARQGDSDAAASLRRVTGLTLVGGKYVYVRGLGERYSGVQMNQFQLPSPEPSRRVVPLDLFPVSIMESIVVQKSYSPDLPGEFGGGVIQLKTRTIPENFFFRGNLTATSTNADNRLSYQGGSKDWLGMDDGSRKMPAAIKNALGAGKKLISKDDDPNGIPRDELTAMGRSLANNYNTDRTSQPNLPGLSLAMGNGWNFSGVKVGTAGSALYGQNSDQVTRLVQGFKSSGTRLERDFTRNSEVSEVETRLAGSFDLGTEIYKDHKITASTFILRNTTNRTQVNATDSFDAPGNYLENTVLDFTERQLWTRYVKGEHYLTKVFGSAVKLDWRLGQSEAKRDSPDRREYSYNITSTSRNIAGDASGMRRTFSNLSDNSNEAAFDLTVPVNAFEREFMKIKMGMNHLTKDRRSDITRLYFDDVYSTTPASLNPGASPEEIFKPEHIDGNIYELKNLTNSADSYSGAQTVQAQYIMTEINPTSRWTLSAGFRKEDSQQDVKTFMYFNPGDPQATSQLKMNDVLPAYSLTWKPTEKIRARLAYSETLARPDFRELSTVGFIDDDTGNTVLGNAALKGTVIKNIDHRWEYYFTSDEYASAGIFYKDFQDPIEVVFIPGVNPIQTFANAKGAQNYGLELEGRMGLRHFNRFLRRWTVLSNVTFIKSQIEIGDESVGTQTSSTRPLQGQSPYVLNMQLQYDRPSWGFSSSLLYNIVGKRITEVGTEGLPDTYEQPFGQMDFVASQVFQKRWSLGFRARNLLNPKVESTQGGEIVRSFQRGRVFSVVLGANF